MIEHVVDRKYGAMDEKKTPLCIGLDPNLALFPQHLLDGVSEEFDLANHPEKRHEAAATAIVRFNLAVIGATADLVGIYKPESAYYEQYGHHGIKALEDTVRAAQDAGAIVILDAKRNDIGATSQAYAEAHLGQVLAPDGTYVRSADDVDLMTVNGYLGSDGIKPFAEVANRDGKGIFVLAKTSNPSSGELQNKHLVSEKISVPDWVADEYEGDLVDFLFTEGPEVFMQMAVSIREWGSSGIGESGYSNVGAVVGATYPEEAAKLRKMLSQALFLMPGYGAQGAKADILTAGFDEKGRGAVVNSSRGITYAFGRKEFRERHPELAVPERWIDAARQATLDAVVDINSALEKADKLPQQWAA